MFLLIPILLILGSFVGIGAIVYRKKPYFLKLASLNQPAQTNGYIEISQKTGFSWRENGNEFFPEAQSFIENLNLRNYRASWLIEAEKFLRRTRLLSLKFDRLSDSLINKIRRVSLGLRFKHEEAKSSPIIDEPVIDESKSEESATSLKSQSAAFLKNEEERLIIEVAKNPKDPNICEALGDLYAEMSNFTDAKESYEAAIELNSQNEDLKKKILSILEKLVQK